MRFHCPLMCKFLTLPWNAQNILKNNYSVTRLRMSYGIREMVYCSSRINDNNPNEILTSSYNAFFARRKTHAFSFLNLTLMFDISFVLFRKTSWRIITERCNDKLNLLADSLLTAPYR